MKYFSQLTYRGKHYRIRKLFGVPKKCSKCPRTKNIHWANISGKYQETRKDWIALCASCHKIFDGHSIISIETLVSLFEKTKMKKEERQLTKEEVLRIPKMVEDGMRYEDIANEFGVHKNTINNWVLKLRKIGYKVKAVKGRRGLLDTLKDNK